ncbi:MAG: DNA polymerase III subunit delta [Candidatus Omnitrophica bacterium]|nr:DNA polymerase III subunit delta [Candidatus Omnitrophota bacterium]
MPRIFPIYLFTGDDHYLKRQAISKLKEVLLRAGSEAFNFDVYEAHDCLIEEVVKNLYSVPFGSGKRLVVLRSAELLHNHAQDILVGYAKNPSPHSCLVMETSKRDIPHQFRDNIHKHVREVSFAVPKGKQLIPWIIKEFKDRKKTIDVSALNILKEIGDEDIDYLRNEMDKLATYVGRSSNVTKKDVENIIGHNHSDNIFEFINALSRKDLRGTFSAKDKLLRSKKSVPEILGMIGWQFRRIKEAKLMMANGRTYAQTSKTLRVPSFYIERFMNEIKSFTIKEIDRDMEYLLETDYNIKRGVMKGPEALEFFIVKVCS